MQTNTNKNPHKSSNFEEVGGLKKGGTDLQTDWQCRTVALTCRLTDKHTDRGHYTVFTLWVEGTAPHALAVWLYLASRGHYTVFTQSWRDSTPCTCSVAIFSIKAGEGIKPVCSWTKTTMKQWLTSSERSLMMMSSMVCVSSWHE